MRVRILSGLMLSVVLGLPAARATADEEDGVKMKLADCPAAVQKTIAREAVGAKVEEIEKEVEDGKTVYETDVTIDGKNYELEVSEDGLLIAKKLDDEDDGDEEQDDRELGLSDCPAAVQRTFKREAQGAKVEEIEKENERGRTIYEAIVTIDGKPYEIQVAEHGTLISKALDDDEDNDDEDDDD